MKDRKLNFSICMEASSFCKAQQNKKARMDPRTATVALMQTPKVVVTTTTGSDMHMQVVSISPLADVAEAVPMELVYENPWTVETVMLAPQQFGRDEIDDHEVLAVALLHAAAMQHVDVDLAVQSEFAAHVVAFTNAVFVAFQQDMAVQLYVA